MHNGAGDKLTPVVVHNGSISQMLLDMYCGRMCFVETPDGTLNYNCLGGCLMNIFE